MQLQCITCSLNNSYVVLQAVAVLVTMASRKKFYELKLL